jgi:hypothetical protein
VFVSTRVDPTLQTLCVEFLASIKRREKTRKLAQMLSCSSCAFFVGVAWARKK